MGLVAVVELVRMGVTSTGRSITHTLPYIPFSNNQIKARSSHGWHHAHHIVVQSRRKLLSQNFAAGSDDPRQAQLEALQNAMKDPEVAARMKAMEEQLKAPAVQEQMAQMSALMSNPQYMAKMAQLREDPDLKPVFEEIQTGGMAAMMKYMNDPNFLSKIGEKMGDAASLMQSPQQNMQPKLEQQPEINTVLDAARYGDVEAIEDFMAVGRGGDRDEKGRTGLHYAVAYNQLEATKALLECGADVNAVDDEESTPLHFAAGYGRGKLVLFLLQAGANVDAVSKDGKRPIDLVTAEPRNPLNENQEVCAALAGTIDVGSLRV